MKREMINLSYCIAGTMLCGLLAFSACDRMEENAGNGEKTEVRFTLGNVDSWGAETSLRGASETSRTVETASFPLDDHWTLEASLVEESAAPTRAPQPDEILNSGQIIHIIAYCATATPAMTEGDYQCTSGGIVPVSDPMVLEVGTTYRLTAYSYNTPSAPPTTSGNTDVPLSPYNGGTNTNDLLFKTQDITVNASGEIALGTLIRPFSRAKCAFVVSGSPSSWSIAASLTTNKQVKLAKSTGVLTVESAAHQSLDETNYRIVYTPGGKPSLNLSGSITGSTSGAVSFNQNVTFDTTLEGGKSYVLRVTFTSMLQWAGSNIYWVETEAATSTDPGKGYLTFAAHGTTDKQFYQGVLFRWGSLVGVSPVQTSGSDDFSIGTQGVPNTGTPIYVYDSGSSGWIRTNFATAKNAYSWNTQQFSSGDDFDYIPAVTSGTTDAPAVNYLASSGVHDPSSFKGDICKYLTDQNNGVPSGNWVMPTKADFASASTSAWTGTAPSNAPYWYREPQTGGFTDDNTQTGTNTDGTYYGWNWGASYCGSTTVFPASGSRFYNDATLYNTGSYGYYWSSSVCNSIGAYDWVFFSNTVVADYTLRGFAFSVRCVLQH